MRDYQARVREEDMVAKKKVPVKTAKAKGKKEGWAAKISRHKGLILFGVIVYAVLFIAFNYFFFRTDVKKDIEAQVVGQVTGLGKTCGEFEPEDVAAIGSDKFVVTDRKVRRILLFNRTGDFLKSIGEAQGNTPQDKVGFADISANDKGEITVVDNGSNSIRVYDVTGKNIQNISLAPMNCYVPRGAYWDGTNFYVADTGGQKIIKVSSTGEMLEKWGMPGNCKDCFNNVYEVVPDGKGNFYAPDYDKLRGKFLNGAGKVQRIIKFDARPNNVAVDGQGNLYVASGEGGGFIKVYNSEGKYQGDLKDAKGAVIFNAPRGINFASDGTLLVAEADSVYMIKVNMPQTK